MVLNSSCFPLITYCSKSRSVTNIYFTIFFQLFRYYFRPRSIISFISLKMPFPIKTEKSINFNYFFQYYLHRLFKSFYYPLCFFLN
jgi:hypothetical protein